MALKFSYRAKDQEGKTRSGIVEASSPAHAVKTLQENKFLVIALSEKRELSLGALIPFWGANRVSETNLAQFTRLLATMLSTGLPLSEALSNLIEQNTGYFREVIATILKDVQGGQSLSASMSQFPGVFNSLYINLVKSGEAAGKVDESLTRLADTLEASLEFKGKIKGALLYPAIIVMVMGGVGTIMITTVIPKIAEVYKEFGSELPLPTRILLAVADFLTKDTILLVIILAFLVFLYQALRKNKTSDFMINNFLFKAPIFGPLSEEVQLTVMSRTLATLISSGVGIIDALKITAGTLGNNYFREGLVLGSLEVERGQTLSFAFRNVPEFPLIVSQLVAIGEETGTVDDALFRLAKFFQDSAERKVKAVTTAMEPFLIVLMGGAVGGLAIAVLLPMFNLVNVIK